MQCAPRRRPRLLLFGVRLTCHSEREREREAGRGTVGVRLSVLLCHAVGPLDLGEVFLCMFEALNRRRPSSHRPHPHPLATYRLPVLESEQKNRSAFHATELRA